ncbi:hypothetical protein RHMOL_Rhmol08G0152300 [Rhododendron molle]|uniref:Uncharacterized protein n=1 Tax=Rhododendron molle TaxID=49168 RepID=A0ACC0MNK5_RHOML|nr:hypothetical protein RHMOL_Rhmol08G0152300 [Rhododendron molle]
MRDLSTASRFDFDGAALDETYDFVGDSSRTEQSTAGYWRLWAYEVLRMYSPMCKHPDLSTLPRALIWSKANMGTKKGRGDLNAFKLYLDDLRASQVPGPLPPRASHTGEYTRAELEQFTRPDIELTHYLRPEMDYAAYQRDRLVGLLGVQAFRDVPNEWVNEAIRLMLAMENVIRRAASGMPLELHYPAPTPPPAQRAAAQRPKAQGQAASRSKRTRPPPQKKIVTRTSTPPVATRRQTRSSLLVEASQEAARQAIAHAEQ